MPRVAAANVNGWIHSSDMLRFTQKDASHTVSFQAPFPELQFVPQLRLMEPHPV